MTSPCTTCVDLTAACPCPAFEGRGTWSPHPEPPECTTCLDVEWLLLSGERWEQVCARLHYSHDGLRRHLGRCGRDDLLGPHQRGRPRERLAVLLGLPAPTTTRGATAGGVR